MRFLKGKISDRIQLRPRGSVPTVMGDAELVIPLEARDDHTHIMGQASIDDRSIQEIIKTITKQG